ncbi:MAG: peptidylprolyl isomerase [Kiritimatiellaeota bacterium]|nr:peptidylprolyl isomerase [Kiritimatiellota bacterium]
MAMLISKFHRLIQSKLLWGAFLVVIVFSFVIWGTKMPGAARRESEERAEGMLNGKPIPPEEFRRAYFNSRLAIGLMIGRLPPPSAEFEKELRHTTWQRIASEQQARALGLPETTDGEVRNAIESQPVFQQDGRFSEQRFAMFVRSTLSEIGANELQFEDYLRQEIMLEKLRVAVASTLQVAPTEVQQAVASLSDYFRLDYAVIPPDTNAGARVTLKEAQALFDRDPKAFTIPEKVRVSYVGFPFSNYVASATTSVDEAVNYYNEHMERFTKLVTVTNPPPLGATNAAPVVSKQQDRIPFDEVKTNIFAVLKQDAARTRAADVASEFAYSLAPDRHGKCLPFADAAKKYNLTIRSAGPFAEGEPVPGLEDVPAVNRRAFALGTNTDECFSDGIRGTDGMYVLYLDQRLPPRVPAFAEVAQDVLEAARAEAKTKAQETKANQVREAIAKAPPAMSLATLVQPFGVSTLTLTGTVMSARTSTNENAEVLLRAAMLHNAGEVCDVQRSTEGSLLVSRVTERKNADETSVKTLHPQVLSSVHRQKLRSLDEAFSAWLLKHDKFSDRRTRVDVEEDQPEKTRSTPAGRTVPSDIY